MRVVTWSLFTILFVTGCSQGDQPPLQAAIIATSTTAPGSSVDAGDNEIGAAAVAPLLAVDGVPGGFDTDSPRCYRSQTTTPATTAMMYFSEDGDALVGGIEANTDAGVDYTAIAGTRRGTSVSVNLVTVEADSVANEDWFFEESSVLLPQGIILESVDCDVVVDSVTLIEEQVTRFPRNP